MNMYLLWDPGVLSSSCAGSGELPEYLWDRALPFPLSDCPSSLYSPGNALGLPWKQKHIMHLSLATFHRDKTFIFVSNNGESWDINVLTSLAQERSCWSSHTCPAAWPGWDGPESAGVWSPAAPVLDAAASCWHVSPQPSVYSLSGRSASSLRNGPWGEEIIQYLFNIVWLLSHLLLCISLNWGGVYTAQSTKL